jgi:exodeoxyribonuclease VII small subunit
MSKAAKEPSPPSTPDPSAPTREKFEVMLDRLETIVSSMESADLPLDQLLAQYEQGIKLVKQCGERLTEAEQFVEVLSKSGR